MREKAKVPCEEKKLCINDCEGWSMSPCHFQNGKTHDARSWGKKLPTILNVRTWTVTDHVFDVVIETFCACKNTKSNL